MKAIKSALKVLAFFAAIGAAIYVGMTYGDKIIAWVKKVLRIDMPECECCCCDDDCCCEEECCCGEECCCEEAAEETAEETAAPAVAEEKDFEG